MTDDERYDRREKLFGLLVMVPAAVLCVALGAVVLVAEALGVE